MQGKITAKDLVYIYNAQRLFDKYNTNQLSKPDRGSMMYFRAEWWGINHIAIIDNVEYNWHWILIKVRDANYPNNWLSNRVLSVYQTWGKYIYSNEWYSYNVYFKKFFTEDNIKNIKWIAKNQQITQYKPDEKIKFKTQTMAIQGNKYYYFTHYDAWDVKQNDNAPCHSANGMDICNTKYKTIAITKDIRIKLNIKFGDTVQLVWEVGCAGKFIVADEMNCRFRGVNAHDNWTCYLSDKKTKASGNVYRPWTKFLIKWDVPDTPWWVCKIIKL